MPDFNTADRDADTRPAPARLSAAWLGVFLAALALFALTAARTVQWQDYGQFTLRIVEGELFNELGLALAHPLHYWAGRLAVAALPTEPAHAVALVSALFGAVTIANVFGCVSSVTGRRDAGLLAALSLAFANTFWRMSTMPECYTVTTAMLSAELWCLSLFFRSVRAGRPRPLWLIEALLFNGLGLANHNLALLTLPILGVVLLQALVRRHICPWRFGLSGAAWLFGASPFLMLVVVEASRTGDVSGAVRSALFGNAYAGQVMNASPSLKLASVSAAFTLLSFANLTLPMAAVGLWRVAADKAGRRLWLAWSAALLIHLLFVLRYNVIDQHTFLLPAYTLIALFAGVGYAVLAGRWGVGRRRLLYTTSAALVLLAPLIYLGTASLTRSRQALGEYARNKPYRDDYRYLFVPWGAGETTAQQMADHAVRLAGDDGVVVVGDRMACFAVRYEAIESGRAGVTVFALGDAEQPPWGDWVGRTVVLVPANVEQGPIEPPAGTHWQDESPMYVLQTGGVE